MFQPGMPDQVPSLRCARPTGNGSPSSVRHLFEDRPVAQRRVGRPGVRGQVAPRFGERADPEGRPRGWQSSLDHSGRAVATTDGPRQCFFPRSNLLSVSISAPQGPMMNSLQAAVSEFGRSLTVPTKLFKLHPRKAGDAAALNPAVVLLVISAFEGFAQNFLAGALFESGMSLGQVAHEVGIWNNPTLKDFQERLEKGFPGTSQVVKVTTIPVRMPPPIGHNLHSDEYVSWSQAVKDSKAWMQIRHCLSHGAVSGWGTERWPPSINSSDQNGQLRRIIYTNKVGEQSVNLQGARSCASVYVVGARLLADAVASSFGLTLDWSLLSPFFEAASGISGAQSPIG